MDLDLHFIVAPIYLEVFGAELEPRADIWTLCVFDFENDVVGAQRHEWDGLGAILARLVEMELGASSEMRIVERQRIDHIAAELARSEMQEESTRVRVGRMVGAQAMVFAHFYNRGNDTKLLVRVVDTETSEHLLSREVRLEGRPDKALESVGELVAQILEGLRESVERPEHSSNRLEAMRKYIEATAMLHRGKLEEARELLGESLSADPSYPAALAVMDQLVLETERDPAFVRTGHPSP